MDNKKRFSFFGGGYFLAFFLFLSLILTSQPAYANNLQITNVSLEDRNPDADTAVVEFDIEWDNSWRDDINHDAVWVFLKVQDTSDSTWSHGDLKTSGTDPVDSDPGSNADLNIDVPTDKIGAFLSRKSKGYGTFLSTNVRLTLDYNAAGISDTDTIKVRVYGIEMVHVPEGAYYLGDNTARTGGNTKCHFFDANDPDGGSVQITSEEDVYISTVDDGTGTAGDIAWNADDCTTDTAAGTLPAEGRHRLNAFLSGWNAFYMMKYELTQGQYRDFLNTLTQAQQHNRVAASIKDELVANEYVMASDGAETVTNRDTIKAGSNPADGSPYTFGCDLNDNDVLDEYDDGENIAMHYVYWPDLCAYADWAGLRPMTELEFEKAARGKSYSGGGVYAWGNSGFPGEYAWGTTKITEAEGPIVNPGEASEVANTTGAGLANYFGDGTSIDGPMRVGFAATNSTTREQSGAGYYGAMDLSGNVYEMVVSIGDTMGRRYEGTHGDGELTTTTDHEGNATNTDWPGIDGLTVNGVRNETDSGSGWRGGSGFDDYGDIDDFYSLRTSWRNYAVNSNTTGRQEYSGGRFARTDGTVDLLDTVIWLPANTNNGDFPGSGRSDYDTLCTDYKLSNLPANCDNHRVFVSITTTDEIRDMTDNFGYSRFQPVYWWHNTNEAYNKLADNWDDMFDSSINMSQATGTGDSNNPWTGAMTTGARHSNDCSATATSFTNGTSSYTGRIGSNSSATGTWLSTSGQVCNGSRRVRCACQISVP